MTWIAFLPLFLLTAAIFLLPGWIGARAFGLSNWGALGFSPAIGIAAVGGWTLLWGGIGLPWNWVAYGVLIALLVILWAAAGATGLTERLATKHEPSSVRRSQVVGSVIGTAAFVAIQFWSISQAMGSPAQIPHLGDADFHIQGALLVFETGRVFPLNALADIYTPGELVPVYYPTLWHGAVALLLPLSNVIEATNALVLVVALVLWPISVTALGMSLLPENRYITFFAPLSVAPLAVFPGAAGIAFSILPFGLATVTLPAGIAALTFWLRTKRARYGVAYGAALLGGIAAQPTVTIMVAAAGGVAVVFLYFRWLGRSVRRGNALRPALLGVAFILLAGFAAFKLRHNAFLVAMASYPREPISEEPVKTFLDGTIAAASQPWTPWIAFLVLGLVALIPLAKDWTTWVTPAMAVITSVAYIASLGPDSTLRALTGPWYKDHLRLGSFASMLIAVLAAVTVAWMFNRLLPQTLTVAANAAIVATIGVAAFGVWVLANPSIAQVLRAHISNGYTLDDQEFTPLKADSVPLMERLDDHFDPGDRLLSAHGNGGGFIVAYSEMKPFIPTRVLLTPEQKYLAAHLDQIETDPRVCEIINDNNITAFLADTSRVGREVWGPLAGPPAVNTDNGFELVDQEGSIKVWRITACN